MTSLIRVSPAPITLDKPEPDAASASVEFEKIQPVAAGSWAAGALEPKRDLTPSLEPSTISLSGLAETPSTASQPEPIAPSPHTRARNHSRDIAAAAAAEIKPVSSSAWTGANTGPDRIKAVRTLIPFAQNAVQQLIASLEEPGHNGGLPLDDEVAALQCLRQLHSMLGELLAAADQETLSENFHNGLATEAAQYAKRAVEALRNDPFAYAMAGTVLAIMTACGLPVFGGFLTSVALSMRKK